MYSKNYYPDVQESLTLPQSYNGTAFTETEHNEQVSVTEEVASATPQTDHSRGDSIPISLPFISALFGRGDGSLTSLKLPNIGTEEILIIAMAAFLFFSKGGDRECAIMLLLLLLIN